MEEVRDRKSILAVAWTTILLVTLWNIVLKEIFQIPLSEKQYYFITFLIVLAGLGLAFIWKAIRPLRPFFGLFVVLIGIQWLVFVPGGKLPFYKALLDSPSINVWLPAEMAGKLVVTLVVIAYLLLLKKKPKEFFLAKGDLAAPAEPVRWLGVSAGTRWSSFGPILAVCLSLGTLAFLVIAGRPPADIVVKALPFLPVVLLAAALNAFNEEMTYKASFLSVLEGVVGKSQSLLLLAAFFGIFHFYGIPYGVIGVLLAAFLGWVLGKSMLETRGLFWAWFLHFLQDVWIFAFLAIGSITPGG
jgi:hypothetical protein